MGLRLRLLLVLILPLILVVAAYGLLRIRQEGAQVREAEARNAAITARAVQIAVEHALRDRPASDLRALLAQLVDGQDHVARIRVFDLAMRPAFSSDQPSGTARRPRTPLADAGLAGNPELAAVLGRVFERGRAESFVERRDGAPWLVHVLALRGRGHDLRGAIEITFATEEAARARATTRQVLVRVGLLTLALALLTGAILQRQLLRPLSRLTRSIRALGEGRPGPPLPIERRDELGAVAEAFNRMAEQLEAGRQRVLLESEHALDLERQLRQAQTLSVAGKLTSGIAHEVGTPLNIISGRAEIALRALPPEHPSRGDLEVIVNQIDRISGIIRSLLDTVRLQKPEIQRVALPPMLDRLVRLLDHLARRRGVTVGATLPEELPEVAADPGQLQQVLLNLLMNALEATPSDGRIAVEAWACPHDGRPGVALAVSDTGSGIPADALGRVFDPFFTTKPPGQGTGLGLAIARDIVRDHGGTLAVQSRADLGTTFTLWLPEPGAAA